MTTTPAGGYPQPTERSLLADFAKTMGADAAAAVWASVCRQLGLARPVTRVDDLIRASDAMMELGSVTRVAGRDARIRLITYRALEGPVLAAHRSGVARGTRKGN